MKKIIFLLAVFCTSFVFGQDFPPLDKSPMDAAYYPTKAPTRSFRISDKKKEALTPKIRVLYSRPQKNDREIFGKLVKYEKPWRVGANETTEIFFMTKVKIGDTEVMPGRYSMIVIPYENQWTLKINKGLDGWGQYSYKEELNVASVTVRIEESEEIIEALSIVLYEKSENTVHLKIGWDRTIVEFPIILM